MKPNILFIVIDSLRADKCYGDKKTSVTPNIDSLIKNGTYFSQTITHGQGTISCMSSILTGLYPFESMTQNEDIFVINPAAETYIENLEGFGYHTHATVQDSLSHIGLSQVFKNNFEMYPVTLKTWTGLGQQVIDKIKENKQKEPWFYYLHLYDLYTPIDYETQTDVKELNDNSFGNTTYERMFSAIDIWIGKILKTIDTKKTIVIITSDHGHEIGAFTESMEKLWRQYRTVRKHDPGIGVKIGQKIAHKLPKSMLPIRKKVAEKYMSKTYEKIKDKVKPELEKIEKSELRPYEKRLMQNAVLPTAHVFDDRVHVPLIFSGYNIPSNKIINQQIRSVDIFPTITDIIGLSDVNYGKRGTTLVPLMQGKQVQEIPAFLESATNSTRSSDSNVIGIRTSKFKYFRDRNDPTKNVHLYDLKNDPLEEKNIAEDNKDVVEEMEKHVIEILKGESLEHKQSKKLTEEEIKKAREALTKLGYI